jgi:hypothetical protein
MGLCFYTFLQPVNTDGWRAILSAETTAVSLGVCCPLLPLVFSTEVSAAHIYANVLLSFSIRKGEVAGRPPLKITSTKDLLAAAKG